MLKGEKYTRLSLPATVAITTYLSWEATCGRFLDTSSEYHDEVAATELKCGDKGFKDSKLRHVYYQKFAIAFADASDKIMKEEYC